MKEEHTKMQQFEAAKAEMLTAKTVEELFEKFRKYPQFKDSAELKKFGATLKEKLEVKPIKH